jgi:hypothetical protein
MNEKAPLTSCIEERLNHFSRSFTYRMRFVGSAVLLMCMLCIFALTLDNLDFSCRYLSGMGTEIEGKVYIPGYFDMAGSSVNSNGNVLPYYEEGKSSLHLIDKSTIVSATGSVHYDKEMLKRTVLVHEATFRKQVYFMTSRFLVIDI